MLYKKDIHYTLKIKLLIDFFSYSMNFLDDIITLIDDSILLDAENSITWWNIIKSWFHWEIDKMRDLIQESERWISEYQKKISLETTISSLKIKFSSAQWYFIEIPHSQSSHILPSFIPRQSLTSVARYTTDVLREFESKLLHASSELQNKEYKVFLDIRNTIKWHYSNIYNISRNISHIDFLSNWAHISKIRSYETPKITSGFTLNVVGGKHPVIALQEPDFISNSIHQEKKDYIHVITWPNMWGKSTYLRQNALLILMGHIGYDIPCVSAEMSIVDKIFSRVGSWDNLYLGQSTFMVEMQEISYILRHSTRKSFVIIDEIWRGTSTYDGMSLAWSILEYNQKHIWAKTLFATHYHEIIDFAESLAGTSNHSVSIWENEKNIVFLRKIIPWWMKKSYGIQVAALAGMPQEILQDAQSLIWKLSQQAEKQQLFIPDDYILQNKNNTKQSTNFKSQEIIQRIKKLDLERISPIQCLQKLSEIQEEIKEF